MKTANLNLRPGILLSLLAGLTVAIGLPVSGSAQESTRTIATGSKIPLTADAPDTYTVKPGDTLWDISKLYLRDPWYWPEIWYVNPQVQNPHLIYPGDVLKLVYVDGQPRVTLAERGEGGGGKRLSPQVRREPLSQAITAIPYDIVASFMGRPTLLDKEQVDTAPYIVAMRNDHIIGASGNEIYARGAAGDTHKVIFGTNNAYLLPYVANVAFKKSDLTPVAALALDEFLLWVNAGSEYKTAKDYIEAVKSGDDKQYKMGGTGSKQEDQIITVALEGVTGGKKFTYVPFAGGGAVAGHDPGVGAASAGVAQQVGQWRARVLRMAQRLQGLLSPLRLAHLVRASRVVDRLLVVLVAHGSRVLPRSRRSCFDLGHRPR